MKKQKGFTLIELLVVISIIGVLAAVVLVSMNSARAKARDAKRLADVRQMQNALELYYDTNGSYPILLAYSRPDTNWTTGFQTAISVYMSKVPMDPGTGEYLYSSTNSGQKYGLAAHMETASGLGLAGSDGGHFPVYYEVGQSPAACQGAGKDWWTGTATNCP